MIIHDELLGLKKLARKYVYEGSISSLEGLDIRLTKPLEICGDVAVRSLKCNTDLIVLGDCSVKGNMFVLSGELKVEGELRVYDLYVKGKLQVGRNVCVHNLTAASIKVADIIIVAGTLETAGTVQAENLSVKYDLYCGQKVDVMKTLAVGKTIDVFDKVRAKSGIKFGGDVLLCKKLEAPKILLTNTKYRTITRDTGVLQGVGKVSGKLIYAG